MTTRTPYDEVASILEREIVETRAATPENGAFRKAWKKRRIAVLKEHGWVDEEFTAEMLRRWRGRKREGK